MLKHFFPQVKRRYWFYGILIAILFVFGLMSVIYEEWLDSPDNIINNLSVESIGFYAHFPNSLSNDKNWQALPTELKENLYNAKPDFFSQEKQISSFFQSEYAYVVFSSENKNYFGWLIYWPEQTLPVLANSLSVATSGNLLIVSNQADEIKDKFFNNISARGSLLTKVWPNFSRPINAPYGYVNFNNLAKEFNLFNLVGSWRWGIYDNYLEIVSLENDYVSLADNKDRQWFTTFYGENWLFYHLNAEEFIWTWQQNQSQEWYKKFKQLSAITGIDIEQELLQVNSFYDLVISTDHTENKQISPWLLSLPIDDNFFEIINKIIAKMLGYFQPQIKYKTLPDKTIIKEIIASEQPVNWQNYNLLGQNIKIIYFTPHDYVFYTLLNNRYIFGNDLKLLNRLITKVQGHQKINSICQNNPTANYSFKLNNKLLSLSYWVNKNQVKYRFCY